MNADAVRYFTNQGVQIKKKPGICRASYKIGDCNRRDII